MVPPARGDRLQGGLRVGLAGARGSRDPRGNRGLAGPSSEGGDPGTDPEHERREAADVTLRPPTNQGKPSSEPGPNHPSRSTMTDTNPNREVATVAGGCFWWLQPICQDLRGLEKGEAGYSGGQLANPSRDGVGTATTGHAEAVRRT